jgi:hypothetical protein
MPMSLSSETATVIFAFISIYDGESVAVRPGTTSLIIWGIEPNNAEPFIAVWNGLPEGTALAELHWPGIICRDQAGNELGRIEKTRHQVREL